MHNNKRGEHWLQEVPGNSNKSRAIMIRILGLLILKTITSKPLYFWITKIYHISRCRCQPLYFQQHLNALISSNLERTIMQKILPRFNILGWYVQFTMFNIQKDELRIVVYFHLHLVLGFQFQYRYKLHSTKQLILLKKIEKKHILQWSNPWDILFILVYAYKF